MPWDDDRETYRRRDPRTARGMRRIGHATRVRRQRLDLSQRDLGALTGVHQSTISRFERGERCGLRWARFALLVDVLGGLDFDDSLDPSPDERLIGPLGLHPHPPIAREQLQRLEARVAALYRLVEEREDARERNADRPAPAEAADAAR